VAVHIANPGRLISPSSLLEQEARARGTTLYLPDQRVPLFPDVLSEVLSLSIDSSRPALVFSLDITRDGELQRYEATLQSTTLSAKLSYEAADASLSSRDVAALSHLLAAALALKQKREERGANSFTSTELLPQVEAGEITLKRFVPTPARDMVSELMIAANHAAAQILARTQTPAFYRSQTRLTVSPGVYRMSRPEISSKPKPHAGLGVSSYVQITSPIRRYNDLLLQRQLIASLQKETPPHDASTLHTLALACEQRSLLAKKLEASARQYWALKYLSLHVGLEVNATITQFESSDTYQAELPAYGLKALVECKRMLQPKDSIQAVIQRVSMKTRSVILLAK
jgi:exoribonuclease-2